MRARQSLRGQISRLTLGLAARVELVARIAKLHSDHVPLRQALARETPPVSLGAWNQMLKQWPKLAAMYDKIESEGVESLVLSLKNSEKGWQRYAWLLERTWPQDFAQPGSAAREHGGNLQVNVQVNVGSDVARRAAAFLTRNPETSDAKPQKGQGRRPRHLPTPTALAIQDQQPDQDQAPVIDTQATVIDNGKPQS